MLLLATVLTATAGSNLKEKIEKDLCQACHQISNVIEDRLESTAAHPKFIEAGTRLGPDGLPLPGRKIDYLNS